MVSNPQLLPGHPPARVLYLPTLKVANGPLHLPRSCLQGPLEFGSLRPSQSRLSSPSLALHLPHRDSEDSVLLPPADDHRPLVYALQLPGLPSRLLTVRPPSLCQQASVLLEFLGCRQMGGNQRQDPVAPQREVKFPAPLILLESPGLSRGLMGIEHRRPGSLPLLLGVKLPDLRKQAVLVGEDGEDSH